MQNGIEPEWDSGAPNARKRRWVGGKMAHGEVCNKCYGFLIAFSNGRNGVGRNKAQPKNSNLFNDITVTVCVFARAPSRFTQSCFH